MKHLACAKVRLKTRADIPGALSVGGSVLPMAWVEALEQNQKIATCCRHPENHELEAWYSSDADRDKGIPDIYRFHCPCGRVHTRFCVGGTDEETGKGKRPFWEVR